MDHKKLLELIDKQGFERTLNGSGHYTIRRHGRRVATIPRTPSDSRSTNNSLATLRRAGLKAPR